MSKHLLSALAICGVLLAAVPVYAAVVRGGEDYALEAGTIVEGDLYTLGRALVLAGTTTGDVVAAASRASTSGAIKGDVAIAAGRVFVGGVVAGDVRLAAGEVTVYGEIGEDLVIIGGNVTITEDARVKGDLLVFGDRLLMQGTVEGVAEAHVRIAEIEGHVDHAFIVNARESLAVRGEAHLGGDLIYTAPRTALISDTVERAGEVRYTPREEGHTAGALDGMRIMFAIVIYAFGAFALAQFFPRFTALALERAFRESGWLTLKGFILVFAIPLAALVACVTILGVLPGVFALLSYGAALALSGALAGVLAGAILAEWLKRKDERLKSAWASLGGIALALVTLLPVLGILVRVLLGALAFGTLAQLAYEHIWQKRRAAPSKSAASKDGSAKKSA